MLKIFDRYLLKKIILSHLLLTLLLLFLVWLAQSLRFAELIISRNISLQTYFSLVFYLIPDLLVLVLPICLLISVIFTYNRLQQDHELLIFKSSGVSFLRLAQPTLIVTAFISMFVGVLNILILPEAAKLFRIREFQIREEFSIALIQPGQFNYIQGATIFVKLLDRQKGCSGIFIDYSPGKSHKKIIIEAEHGHVSTYKNGLLLALKNGARQEIDLHNAKISDFTFKELTYHIALKKGDETQRMVKPYERPMMGLLFPSESDKRDKVLYPKLLAEGHQRIIGIFLPLLYVGWALFFLFNNLSYRRRDYKIFGKIFLCVMSIHTSILYCLNLNGKWHFSIYVAYIILIISLLIPYIHLIAPIKKSSQYHV